MPQQNTIYLDHAAATPLDPAVLAAMLPFLKDEYYNPSALYSGGRTAKQALEAARAKVAACLGAKPGEIVFTSGGTEGDNLAVQGIMNRLPQGNLVVSSVEHEAVLEPARRFDVRYAAVDKTGRVDPDSVMAISDDQTVLISVMYANNEVGTVQPIKELAEAVARIRRSRTARGLNTPLYLHTDACQAAAYLSLQVSRLGVDLMTLNGGKMYGPKGSGVLYLRTGVELEPILYGGGHELNRRSGTENVAGAVGFALALEAAQAGRYEEGRRLGQLQQLFYDLLEAELPGAVVNGSRKYRLPNNVHVTFPGQDNERLMMQLDERGIQTATGSACAASSQAASHVLLAMGLTEDEARASLRFSMGRATTEQDVRRTVADLAECVNS